MTEHLKYLQLKVGERVLIGIVVDQTKKKINLFQSYKKVKGFYRIHVISEFWLIKFASRVIRLDSIVFKYQ